MKTYELTAAEASRYDADDAQISNELRARFGRLAAGEPVTTEVVHPDGYVVSAHTSAEH